jgi:PAS domain-containing protein
MTLEELQGMIDAPFNEPDYTQQYVRDDAFVFNSGQTLNIPEEPVTRYDGVVRNFSTIKTPLRNEQGQIVMTVGVSRDVTEQLQYEVEIRQSQQQLAAIAANIPGGVFRWIYHADGSHSCPYVIPTIVLFMQRRRQVRSREEPIRFREKCGISCPRVKPSGFLPPPNSIALPMGM